MAIDDVDPEYVAEVSLRDHLEAALANASDETARFHVRQALQLHVEAQSHGAMESESTATTDGDSRAT